MKKIYILILLALATAGLAAQNGLFGLSYGDNLNRADSLMSNNGFVAWGVEGSLVKYSSDYNKLVESVILFVNPDTEILAGWFVRYNRDNTEEQDNYVIDSLHRMHGDGVKLDPERGKMTWIFDEARNVTASYDSVGSLCVYYYDADFDMIFALPPTMEASGGKSSED